MIMLGTHEPRQHPTLTKEIKIPEIFFRFRFCSPPERNSYILGIFFARNFFCEDGISDPKLRGRQLGDGMGGGRNGCFWGAPILHQNPEKCCIFQVLAKNRGAPKVAVPTTTHPIPQLTPS